MKSILNLLLIILLSSCQFPSQKVIDVPQMKIPYQPQKYVCYYTSQEISIDGLITDSSWNSTDCTNTFVDIEGSLKPTPELMTRVKMLWDSNYFYIAAWLEEPHIWAKLRQHDTVIFYDNDFEVFIDPDGDTHNYYELELNALNTVWDLLLLRPYRDGSSAINSWDIKGLVSAVHCNGTLNNATDIDSSWTIELAIPWDVLKECAPDQKIPSDGDQWRINFSRVEWETDHTSGSYNKIIDQETGKAKSEHNWVWSPQGVIAMHQPETWGFVQFSKVKTGTGHVNFVENPTDNVKWYLRQIYYAQNAYFEKYGCYSNSLSGFVFSDFKKEIYALEPAIFMTETTWEATVKVNDSSYLVIDQKGKIQLTYK